MVRDALRATGLRSMGWATSVLRLHRPTIFCFHSVVAADATGFQSRMAVRVSFIVALAGALRRAGVPVIPLAEALHRLREGDDAAFAVLTFDDGYRDNYEILYPAMLAHALPFTIFVTTGLVDRTMPMWWDAIDRLEHAGELSAALRAIRATDAPDRPEALTDFFRCIDPERQRQCIAALTQRSASLAEWQSYDMALTWPMLREMHASGLLTIGAHSCTHPLLSRLSREEVLAESVDSRRRIEAELDAPVSFFAYPFGQPAEVGDHGVWAARYAGFDAAFTTQARPVRRDDVDRPFEMPRILLSAGARRHQVAVAYMSGGPAAVKRSITRDRAVNRQPRHA